MKTDQEFINFIHKSAPTIYRTYFTVKSGEPSMKSICITDVSEFNRTSCIYYLPCIGGTKLSQIHTYPAFYVDLDGSETESETFKNNSRIRIQEFGLEPSAIIETVRGLHVYWVLDEPLHGPQGSEADLQWRLIQKKLATFFDGDHAVCSPHQPMRLPYTWHRKDPANPYWIQITDFSGQKYSIEELDLATRGIEVPEKSKPSQSSARSTGQSRLVLDHDNLMIRAISYGNIGYLQNALLPAQHHVETLQELHTYLTRKIDLKAFLGISGSKFCCPFHDDEHPSASITVLDTGEQFFKCFGCGIRGNIRSLIRHIRGESSYRATNFLKQVFRIEHVETEWQIEQRSMLLDLKETIAEEIPNYPELFRNVHLDLMFYNVLIDEAIRNVYDERYTSMSGHPIFFTSYSRLAALYGIKDRKTVGRKVVNLALHRLIRRVPDHEVPGFLLSKSRVHQGAAGAQYRVSYYELTDLTPRHLLSANDRATEVQNLGVTKQGFTRESILRAFGEEIAAEVYEQGEHRTTEVQDQRQIDMIEFVMERIEENGFCYEDELVVAMATLWNYGKTVARQGVKRLLPEMLMKYELSRIRLTRELKDRLRATSKGSKAVIMPLFQTRHT